MVDFQLPTDAMGQLAGPLETEQCVQLTRYGLMVQRTSGRVNVVSRRSLSSLQEHFVDSAALLSFREVRVGTLADLGSGAGFPGVVLALLRPHVRVTLVESQRRKVVFLKRVARDLAIPNLEVVHARIEDLRTQPGFDLAVARALDRSRDLLPLCLELVGKDGALVLFKGPRWQEEAADVAAQAATRGFSISRTQAVALPGLGRSTTFVELARVSPERHGRCST